jgi:type II secretory ATPase GspE/PulE/Tfp pilus assembly ATPase PilB-like protein
MIQGYALPDSGILNVRILRGPADPVEEGGGFLSARLQVVPAFKRRIPLSREDALAALQLRTPARPDGSLELPGYAPSQIAILERLIRLSRGILLVTGPVNSGKTRTMWQAMRWQAQLFPENRQITIENPPEFPMPWAICLPASEEKGHTYLELFEHTLRMDPNILQLSELRTVDEAMTARQAADTGRLAWATMHLNDPYRFAVRLEGFDHLRLPMSVTCDPELIAGIIGQRVISLLCPACKKPADQATPEKLPPYLLDRLRTWPVGVAGVHVRGSDPTCTVCHGAGIHKRIAVAEVIETNPEMMEHLRARDICAAKREHRARPDADRSMLEQTIDLVLSGQVAPQDAHRVVQLLAFDVAKQMEGINQ